MSNLKEKKQKLQVFFQKDIWRIPLKDLPPARRFLIKNLRIILIVFRGIGRGKLGIRASSLTFYTLLSLVPVLAILFGISKGFGFEEYLEKLLYDNFSIQDEFITQVINVANKIIEQTRGGVMAGVAIIVLVWSIIKVLTTIERTFNEIWQIKKSRVIVRKFSDYFLIILLAPALMILGSSSAVFISTQVKSLASEWALIGYVSPMLLFAIKLVPYVMVWFLLTLIYMIVPNTRVKFKPALVSGIIAGTIYQIVQYFYIKFQIGVTGYNAIYGSFAALPLFLIWVNISWTIVLIGAEISFARQHVGRYDFESGSLNISHTFKRTLALLIIHRVVIIFSKGLPALTTSELSDQLEMPYRLTNMLVNELVECNLLTETYTEQYKQKAYLPARDINQFSINFIITSLNNFGEDDIIIGDSTTRKKIEGTIEEFNSILQKHPSNVLIGKLTRE